MTSILAFRIDNGNQMIVVGDRQVTGYNRGIDEVEKIWKHNSWLYAGAGDNNTISNFYDQFIESSSFEDGIKKLEELRTKKKGEMNSSYISPEDKMPDLLVIDTTNFVTKFFRIDNLEDIQNICLIGSGRNYLTSAEEKLQGINLSSFPSNKEILYNKLLEIYDALAKQDIYTGHPAFFGLDVWVLTRNQTPKHYVLKSKPEVNLVKSQNYVEVEQ